MARKSRKDGFTLPSASLPVSAVSELIHASLYYRQVRIHILAVHHAPGYFIFSPFPALFNLSTIEEICTTLHNPHFWIFLLYNTKMSTKIGFTYFVSLASYLWLTDLFPLPITDWVATSSSSAFCHLPHVYSLFSFINQSTVFLIFFQSTQEAKDFAAI